MNRTVKLLLVGVLLAFSSDLVASLVRRVMRKSLKPLRKTRSYWRNPSGMFEFHSCGQSVFSS